MLTTARFTDFEGNQKLTSLLRKGSLPPSSLFIGPEGIGKKTFAVLLAAAANCKGRPEKTDELCGRCSSCRKVFGGNHPDIQIYGPEGKEGSSGRSIKIEAMRNLRKEAYYRPFEGSLRFFIIDEAEKMTEEASNCILKVLEEPPLTTKIILVTAYPALLLPTIRSRCQAFRFKKLAFESILRLLEEKTELDDPPMRAAFAQGSFGRAVSLDLEETKSRRDAMLNLLAGFLKNETFSSIFYACQSEPIRGLIKNRSEVEEMLNILTTICHDIYSIIAGVKNRITNQDRIEELENLANKLSLDRLGKILYHIRQAEKDLSRNVGPQICFETLWLSVQGAD
jgi:DNA polymerase-3 subunit delta'